MAVLTGQDGFWDGTALSRALLLLVRCRFGSSPALPNAVVLCTI